MILQRPPFGIYLQALGGSESASRSAGVKVTRTRILAYVASGTGSALAGVVLAGRTQSGDPNIGAVYLLNGIAPSSSAGRASPAASGPSPARSSARSRSRSSRRSSSSAGCPPITSTSSRADRHRRAPPHSLQAAPGSEPRPRARGPGGLDEGCQPRSYVRPVEVAVPYAFVVLGLFVGCLTTPGFLSPNHLSSISETAGYVGIIALGETLVLLLGGIDLSVPYMINLAAVLVAGFQSGGMSSTQDILLVLLVGPDRFRQRGRRGPIRHLPAL